MATERFVFLTDLHWGYERRGGHKVALHDVKAWKAVLAFVRDYRPHHIILGGDILDCGSISHHNKGKPGRTEGLRLLADAMECRREVIAPLESVGAKTLTYIEGNHENWIVDLLDEEPALDGLLNLEEILKLSKWKVIPQGGAHNLGKLTFLHGDTVKGGENVAKAAVINYERNVRFGHHHTYQVYAKNSALDYKNGKTGIAIPCLCTKTPKYGEGAPNRWLQGFNFGTVGAGGYFNDYVAIIVDGSFTAPSGKVY